jgi:hypothetical protein
MTGSAYSLLAICYRLEEIPGRVLMNDLKIQQHCESPILFKIGI